MNTKSEENAAPEGTIFHAIGINNLIEFKSILSQHKGSVDLFDENGMTALQHAAFKGNKDMVQLLLDRGADVSAGKHEYNYTALHCGALSGSAELCKLLLDAGANPTARNSVGRTASQMAAFVGNHHIVATINTFIPRSEVEYFSIIQGQQTEPYLPGNLVENLYKFVLSVNIHPVRVALNLQHTPSLLENAEKVIKVLELMCKREMTRGSETNEVMAFKYHYLAYLTKELNNVRDRRVNTDKDDKKRNDEIDIFIKRLLKPGKDGFSLDVMDIFLKDCVREFPYRECTTFHQMATALTSQDPPPALYLFNCTINGQRGFVDTIPSCNTCGEEKPAKKCAKCKSVQYCDRECQRLHWFVHKKACNRESGIPAAATNSKLNIDTKELSSELENLITG